jgi:predicted esterase
MTEPLDGVLRDGGPAGVVRLRVATVVTLILAVLTACAAGQSASEPGPSSGQPSPSSTGTPFDGIWASQPLTRADMSAALDRRNLSDERLDEWIGPWEGIDYRIFEIEIGGGRWTVDENGEGVSFGPQLTGDFGLSDPHTAVVEQDDPRCRITYDLSRDGDELSVSVLEDACSDDADLSIQTIVYESSPFILVQPAGWAPPELPPPASPGPSPSTETSTSSTRQTLRPAGTVDGAPLGYVEYLPPDYGDAPSPLLVYLHGSGESGPGDETALARLAGHFVPGLIAHDQWPDGRPFVVLSPQHDDVEPSFCFEADEVDAFLRFALEHYDIDPSRVYLTGYSCGAIGLWNYLGAYRDELVAAAIPVAGYGIGAIQATGCGLVPLPIWAFHGQYDTSVPVRGDAYPLTALQRCTDEAPVNARLSVIPGAGHDIATDVYEARQDDIYAWLLGQQK